MDRIDNEVSLPLELRQSLVEQADIRQEAALRELETGKKVSMRVIRNYLLSSDRVLYYGTYYHPKIETAKIPWSGSNQCHPLVVNRIIDWLLEQSPEIQEAVFNFLDLSSEEKEEALPLVLETLGLGTEEIQETKEKPKKKHMSDIMRDSLPATKDSLIALIQSVSPETKRPASTVRQWIREDTRNNKIFLGNDGNYHNVK